VGMGRKANDHELSLGETLREAILNPLNPGSQISAPCACNSLWDRSNYTYQRNDAWSICCS
jgi:hypothetical protein